MITLTSAQQAIVKSDSSVKTFRVHFPNGELPDLTNDDIVYESVSFQESVCSEQTFRFGCAEASVIEFETVGVQNIVGMTIECSMTFTLEDEAVTIPYGVFVIDTCPRDHSAMTHRKVTAYAPTVSDAASEVERYKMRIPRITTDTYNPNILHLIGGMCDELLEDMTATAVSFSTEESHIEAEAITSFEQTDPKTLFLYDSGGGLSYYLNFGIDQTSQLRMHEVDPDAVYKIKLYKGTGYDTYLSLARQTVEQYGLTMRPYNDFSHAFLSDNHWGGGAAMYTNLEEGHIKYRDKGTWVELTIYPYLCDASLGEYISYLAYLGTWDLGLWDRATDTKTTIQANLEIYSSIEVTKYVGSVTSLRESFDSTLQGVYVKGALSTTTEIPYVTFINAFSPRDIVEGFAELNASFGRCNRDGTLSIRHLDSSNPYALTAADVEGSAWWDEYNIYPIGRVLFKYTEENEEMTSSYTFGDGVSVYDMTDNQLLLNLSATVEEVSAMADMTDTSKFYVYNEKIYFYNGTEWVQSVAYEDAGSVYRCLINLFFVPYANTVRFTPLDANFRGMPYLQAGDAITLTAGDGTVISSYILDHTFEGIQYITEDVSTVQGSVIGSEVQF